MQINRFFLNVDFNTFLYFDVRICTFISNDLKMKKAQVRRSAGVSFVKLELRMAVFIITVILHKWSNDQHKYKSNPLLGSKYFPPRLWKLSVKSSKVSCFISLEALREDQTWNRSEIDSNSASGVNVKQALDIMLKWTRYSVHQKMHLFYIQM